MADELHLDQAGGAGQQRIRKRSALFVWAPIAALVVVLTTLVWEVVRLNVDDSSRSQWPLRLTLLPIDTAATLSAAIGGLILARAQFAQTQRPTISFGLDSRGQGDWDEAEHWDLYLFNGGPGSATVVWCGYSAIFRNQVGGEEETPWLTPPQMRKALTDRGFRGGRDYFLFWLGKGYSLVPAQGYRDGVLMAWFSRQTIRHLVEFRLKVRVGDAVGDEHERVIDYVHHFPVEVKSLRPE
ncbi:hypothetical protein [Verrucosispora sp. WMMC514]|uniref:hypothetical protein n=1 Tax=Verrucosispora sp. WMMC514 TaxID=3015156 RepID=UPI00248B4798|nr:hypothetical protein [Verrucosispora sp. WMMC514]WBB92705.1 hypothetical protein O7597_06880 [Verrucosispora sp. WMMC514]